MRRSRVDDVAGLWQNSGMVAVRVLFGLLALTAAGRACSCSGPPTLCAWLQPNMVAFTGRLVSTSPSSQEPSETRFAIEERLWGKIPQSLISVVGSTFVPMDGLGRSWFVLALVVRDTGNGHERYFVERTCCPVGMVLPPDHNWVKQFRENFARRTPATMTFGLRSNFITLADFRLRLSGAASSWEGGEGAATVTAKVPPGEYSVSLTKPHFTLAEESRRVSLLPGSCAEWSLEAEPTATIAGTIAPSRGAAGQTVFYELEGAVPLEPLPPDPWLESIRRWLFRKLGWEGPAADTTTRWPRYFVTPGADGRFRMPILPGRYRLTARSVESAQSVSPPPIPKTYYPGVLDEARATEIEVPVGATIENITFRLPEYGPTRKAEIALVHQDGSPARNVVVAYAGRFRGDRYQTVARTQKQSDAKGRLVLELWPSVDYRLEISNAGGDNPFVNAGVEPVRRRFTIRR